MATRADVGGIPAPAPVTATGQALAGEEETTATAGNTSSSGHADVTDTSTSPPQLEVDLPAPLSPGEGLLSSPPSTTAAQPLQASTAETEMPPPIVRRETEEALGPASDAAVAAPRARQQSAGPALNISLMLLTGARHPYRIDEKYLRSRRVEVATMTTATAGNTGTAAFDPRAISGYQLKELILKDWRTEWEPKPASPDSIRLIIMGRMIDDKSALRDFPFKLDSVNVVHMAIKPADTAPDDDDTATKKGIFKSGHGGGSGGDRLREREPGDRRGGCRCVIL